MRNTAATSSPLLSGLSATITCAHLHADYAVCDAMSLPFSDATFDVIIANVMLYHFPDIPKALLKSAVY